MSRVLNQGVLLSALTLAISLFLIRYEGLVPRYFELLSGLGALLLCAYLAWRFLLWRTGIGLFIYGVCFVAQNPLQWHIPILSQTASFFFFSGPNPLQIMTISFIVCVILLEILMTNKFSRLIGAMILFVIFIVYDMMYHLPMFASLGFAISFAVISEAIPTEKPRYEGLWAFLLSMLVLMIVALGNHYLPYEKVRQHAMSLLPQSWVQSVESSEKRDLGGPLYHQSDVPLLRIQTLEVPLYLRCEVYHIYDGHRWLKRADDGKVQPDLPTNGDHDRYFSYKGVKPKSSVPFGPLGMKSSDSDGLFYYSGVDYREPYQEERQKMNRPEYKAYLDQILLPQMNGVEKIKALQQALLKHGKYQLNVKMPPNDQDFVSYFLFENPQGYCTYYASTMVVLAREAGIPARYVEGFVTNPLKVERGEFIITEQESHAWAEVYLDEMGWQTIDATPLESLTHQTRLVDETSEPIMPVNVALPNGSLNHGDSGLKQGSKGMVLILGVTLFASTLFILWSLYWGTGRFIYQRKSRSTVRRCCAYLEEMMGRYEDASGVVNQFDGIMKAVERVLYAKEANEKHAFEQIIAFTKRVEKCEKSKVKRLWNRLVFLKGWHYD